MPPPMIAIWTMWQRVPQKAQMSTNGFLTFVRFVYFVLRTPPQVAGAERTRLRQTVADLLCREPSSWNEVVRQRHDRRPRFDHAFRQDPHLRDRNERHCHRPLTNLDQVCHAIKREPRHS